MTEEQFRRERRISKTEWQRAARERQRQAEYERLARGVQRTVSASQTKAPRGIGSVWQYADRLCPKGSEHPVSLPGFGGESEQ